MLSILVFEHASGFHPDAGTNGIAPFHAMQQFVLLPLEATEFNTLTICVTFGVSPYWSHLNIGLSPIKQSSEKAAFIVSFYYYKTF